MSQPIHAIDYVIKLAKISQYSFIIKNKQDRIYRSGALDSPRPLLLYMERKALEWLYNLNPNDTSLPGTADSVYAICLNNDAVRIAGISPCTSPTILVQPISQILDSGSNVVFSVVVAGTGTISYQWYFNGVAIGGATNASYSITGITSANAGNYYCIVSNNCGSMQTLTATLTVNVIPIVGFWSYGDVDPSTDLNNHIDNFTYQVNYPITHNADINVPLTQAGSNNKFSIWKIPATESAKTNYVNAFQNGSIPDAVLQSPITFGGFTYYFTRNASSWDYTQPFQLKS